MLGQVPEGSCAVGNGLPGSLVSFVEGMTVCNVGWVGRDMVLQEGHNVLIGCSLAGAIRSWAISKVTEMQMLSRVACMSAVLIILMASRKNLRHSA